MSKLPIAVCAVLAWTLAAPATFIGPIGTPVPPLVAFAETVFETPYAPQHGSNLQPLALSAVGPVAYAVSNDQLFVVGTADGSVHEVVALAQLTGDAGFYRLQLAAGPPERLLAWSNRRKLLVFSLADPRRPELERIVESLPLGLLEVVPGTDTAVVYGGGSTHLVCLDTGELLFDFPRAEDVAVGRAGGGPIIVVNGPSPNAGMDRLFVYEGASPPVLRAEVDVERTAREIFLSSSGRLLIVPHDRRIGGERFREFDVHDALSGRRLSAVRRAGDATRATIVDGATSTMVLFNRDGLELWDLGDPTDPTPAGDLALGVIYPSSSSSDPVFRLSEGSPVLYVAVQAEKAVAVVDVDRRAEIGRLSTGPVVPTSMALDPGRRELAVSAARALGDEVFERGGVAELRFVDTSNPVAPVATGRMVRNQPRQVTHLAQVGPDAVVALDYRTQSVALVRVRDGAVLDTAGFGRRFVGNVDFRALDATNGLFTMMNRDTVEIFSALGGRIRLLDTVRLDGGFIGDSFIRPDGAIVYRESIGGQSRLVIRALDGRTSRLDRSGTILGLSPDGATALARVVDSDFDLCLLDLSDVTDLKEAWCNEADPLFSQFAAGGDRVLQVFIEGSRIFSSLLDASTGAMIGDESIPESYWLYLGVATLSPHPTAERAVLWRRVLWSPFVETLLYDITGETPELVATGPPRWTFDPIGYAPRSNGGLLETVAQTFGATSTAFYLTDPDGSETRFDVDGQAHRLPVSLGRGRFATTSQDGLSFWLDTEAVIGRTATPETRAAPAPGAAAPRRHAVPSRPSPGR